jgi:glyoxylate reductase
VELQLNNGHVFVTRRIPPAGIDLLAERVSVTVNELDLPLGHSDLQDRAAANDGMLTLLTDPIDRGVLERGSTLKVVANVAVGYDNIDVAAATDLGIAVTNTPGVLTDTTADFAWALLMASARRVVEGDAYMRSGKYTGWGIQLLLGQDIHHATLGIVGMGRIGQGVARRASGFDMKVVYYDEYRLASEREAELAVEYVPLDHLFSVSDFVTIHTPLTPDTRHLVNFDRLTTMKSTAILVNTSRGPVVNEADLARALREGVIAGAALDVFENEPEANPDLLGLPNIILAPHIASASVATRTRMATMAAENCLALLSGATPPNLVNPEVMNSNAFTHRMQLWI